MRPLFRSLIVSGTIALGILLSAGTTHAYVQNLRFTTAFSFVAGGMVMPPGTYTVQRTSALPSVVLLSNTDTRKGALMQISSDDLPRETPYESGVRFQNQNGTYVLTKLWDSPIGPASATPALPADRHR